MHRRRSEDLWRFWSGPARRFAAAWGTVLCLATIGCHEEAISYREVKRVDERVTAAELKSFFAVVDSLPEKALPPLPSIDSPAPQWSITRTLPVGELVREEQKAIIEHTSVEWLARHCNHVRALKRALRRERMTLEQFFGLVLTMGTALSVDEVDSQRDLDVILARGKRIVAGLVKDQRVFSALTEDGAYHVLEQASWIPLIDRVQRLKQVPPENLALARRHHDRLKAIFPKEFTTDPLAGFAKILENRGAPFVELPSSGSDERIEWSREQAIVGTDTPPPAKGTPPARND